MWPCVWKFPSWSSSDVEDEAKWRCIFFRIPTSYRTLLSMRERNIQFVILWANRVNWGHRHLWSFFKGLTDASSGALTQSAPSVQVVSAGMCELRHFTYFDIQPWSFSVFSSPSVLCSMMEIHHTALSIKAFYCISGKIPMLLYIHFPGGG